MLFDRIFTASGVVYLVDDGRVGEVYSNGKMIIISAANAISMVRESHGVTVPDPTPPPEPKFRTILLKEAAVFLGVSVPTVRRMIDGLPLECRPASMPTRGGDARRRFFWASEEDLRCWWEESTGVRRAARAVSAAAAASAAAAVPVPAHSPAEQGVSGAKAKPKAVRGEAVRSFMDQAKALRKK